MTTGYGRHRKLGVGFRTAGYGRHRSQWVKLFVTLLDLPTSDNQRLGSVGKDDALRFWINKNITEL